MAKYSAQSYLFAGNYSTNKSNHGDDEFSNGQYFVPKAIHINYQAPLPSTDVAPFLLRFVAEVGLLRGVEGK